MPRWTFADSSARFDAKVKNAPSGCIEWTAATNPGGYGLFGEKRSGKWKLILAHRFAWECVNGAIPDGLFVLHHCDNRRCVNPSHLFVGTRQDNTDDMLSKNRQARGDAVHPNGVLNKGSNNGMAVLSDSQIVEIRQLLADGVVQQQIAKRFRIDQSSVSRISTGARWAHL